MPVQVMTADQHPGGKSCDDHQRRRKKHQECHDDDEDECECDEDDDDDDCDPLTDEKYSLADIVKIMKRLREGKCDEHECNECEDCNHHDACDECCP